MERGIFRLAGEIEPTVCTLSMVSGRRSIAGCCIDSIAETQEMLDFGGEHNITADCERICMDVINDAFEGMLKRDVK